MDLIARHLRWNAPDLELSWATVFEVRSNATGVRFKAKLEVFVRGSVIFGGCLDSCDSLNVIWVSAIRFFYMKLIEKRWDWQIRIDARKQHEFAKRLPLLCTASLLQVAGSSDSTPSEFNKDKQPPARHTMNTPPPPSRPRRPSLQLLPPNTSYSGSLSDLYSDARTHGYSGHSKTVRLPRATASGGGAIAKSEDGTRCVVAGRECSSLSSQ